MFILCTIQYVYHIGAFGQFFPGSCARCSGVLGSSRLLGVTDAEQRRGGQEPVYQSETKTRFMIRGRGWNSSELTSPPRRLCNMRLPFHTKPSPPFLLLVSLPLRHSEIPDMLFFSPAPPLIVNRSSQRNAVQFWCCDFGGISVFVTLSLCSLKLCAVRSRGADSGLFHSVLFMCTLGVLCWSNPFIMSSARCQKCCCFVCLQTMQICCVPGRDLKTITGSVVSYMFECRVMVALLK